MYCKFCGSSIEDNSVFCSVCGKKQTLPTEKPEKEEEFYDVFAYWSSLSPLRRLAFMFIFGAAALWAAMLVLTVFFS